MLAESWFHSWDKDVLLWYLLVISFRLLNCISIQTFFNPDEYWQSLEIAHADVFGYGFKTWEWSSEWAVRSAIYPSIISVMYYLLKLFHCDFRICIIYGPKILHGFGSALTDIMIYRCSHRWFSSQKISQTAVTKIYPTVEKY